MLVRFVLVVGLWGAAVLPVAAQEMPAWAAPQELPEDPPSPPSMPQDPEIVTVPVDGGLALLALAGAGYAVRRRRR